MRETGGGGGGGAGGGGGWEGGGGGGGGGGEASGEDRKVGASCTCHPPLHLSIATFQENLHMEYIYLS